MERDSGKTGSGKGEGGDKGLENPCAASFSQTHQGCIPQSPLWEENSLRELDCLPLNLQVTGVREWSQHQRESGQGRTFLPHFSLLSRVGSWHGIFHLRRLYNSCIIDAEDVSTAQSGAQMSTVSCKCESEWPCLHSNWYYYWNEWESHIWMNGWGCKRVEQERLMVARFSLTPSLLSDNQSLQLKEKGWLKEKRKKKKNRWG